jgi:hypothetical protein
LPRAPSTFVYSTCDRQTQGISVGWADIYGSELDDQWIDVQGVPPGEYWLETVIDPDQRLVESNESNNVVRNRVVIGAASYAPDRFDLLGQNDPQLGTGDKRLTDLSVHRVGDIDRFRWIAPADGTLEVQLTFDRALGDTDVYIWSSGTVGLVELASATPDASGEQVAVAVQSGQTYFIDVKDLSGQTQPDYDLTINGPDIVPDAYEPNDSVLDVADLGQGNRMITGLNAHQAGDRDHFAWTAEQTGRAMIDRIAVCPFRREFGPVRL